MCLHGYTFHVYCNKWFLLPVSCTGSRLTPFLGMVYCSFPGPIKQRWPPAGLLEHTPWGSLLCALYKVEKCPQNAPRNMTCHVPQIHTNDLSWTMPTFLLLGLQWRMVPFIPLVVSNSLSLTPNSFWGRNFQQRQQRPANPLAQVQLFQ